MIDHAKFYERIEQVIAEHGHMVMGVGGSDGTFSYTIGNTEARLPELLILGVEPEGATMILNAVVAALGAQQPQDGQLVYLGGGGKPVRLRALEGLEAILAREDYIIQACRYYRREDLPVMLVECPDLQGRFPDEEGCDPDFVRAQTMRVH